MYKWKQDNEKWRKHETEQEEKEENNEKGQKGRNKRRCIHLLREQK